MLLCLCQSRWLGTRGVLLLAGVAVFLLQLSGVGPFLLFPLAVAAVLALAAWRTMMGDHLVGRGHWLRNAAFVAAVLLGAQCALLLAGLGLSLHAPCENRP